MLTNTGEASPISYLGDNVNCWLLRIALVTGFVHWLVIYATKDNGNKKCRYETNLIYTESSQMIHYYVYIV